MVDFNNFRAVAVTVGSALGGLLGMMYGEMTQTFMILLIFMAIDYISGIIVAVVFKASPKTTDGAVDSRAGVKGLFRKGGMLAVVLVAHWLDVALHTGFVMEMAIVAFIVNEGFSILENMALAGVPVPEVVTRSFTQLEERAKGDDKHE